MLSVLDLPTDNPQLMNLAAWLETQPHERRLECGCKSVTLFYEYYLPDFPSVLAPVFVEEIVDDLSTLAIVRKRVAHWKTLDAKLHDILMGTSGHVGKAFSAVESLRYNWVVEHVRVGRLQ